MCDGQGPAAAHRRAASHAQRAAESSLESLAGDYQSSGLLVQVKLRTDGVLTIAFPKQAPPQPVRELVPLGICASRRRVFRATTLNSCAILPETSAV